MFGNKTLSAVAVILASISVAVIIKNGYDITYDEYYEALYNDFNDYIDAIFKPIELLIDLVAKLLNVQFSLYQEAKYIFTLIMLKATADFRIDTTRGNARKTTARIALAIGLLSAITAVMMGSFLNQRQESMTALISVVFGVTMYEFLKAFRVGPAHRPRDDVSSLQNFLYNQKYFTFGFMTIGVYCILFAIFLDELGINGFGVLSLLLFILSVGFYHIYLSSMIFQRGTEGGKWKYLITIFTYARGQMALNLILIVVNSALLTLATVTAFISA